MLKVTALLVVLLAVHVYSRSKTRLEVRKVQSSKMSGLNPGNSNCGSRIVQGINEQKRIVGGQESVQSSWPWQVALFFKGTQFCAGSLVNRQWVVTASHCFHYAYSSTKPEDWFVTLGDHKLGEKESFEQSRNISKIILHPKYVSMVMEGIYDTPPDYDIAMIKLDTPINYDRIVQPICLLNSPVEFFPGKECYVTGWGHTQFNGTQPDALNEAKVKLVSAENCNKKESYAGMIHGRALCARFEEGGVDACQYDSGGPLACQYYRRYYLTGIVSWGHGCASPHKYVVYSNMKVMTSWVIQTIKENDSA